MSDRLYGVPTFHEQLIERVCAMGFAETGFRHALDRLAGELDDPDATGALVRTVGRGRPDAWRLDLERSELTIVEVEVGNPMSDAVLQRWAMLALYVDGDSTWTMRLWRVDRWGTITEVDWVGAIAYDVLSRQQERENREQLGVRGGPQSAV